MLCLLVAGALLVPEALPRPFRGVSTSDLGRLERGTALDLGAALQVFLDARASNVAAVEAERERLVLRLEAVQREGMLRNGQTGLVLLLFAASAFHFLLNVRGAFHVWRATPSRIGIIEVMEPQNLAVTDEQAREHARKLVRTRAAAIHAVYPRVAYRCGYCGKRSRWARLGRIGKRTVRRRPPPDAKDLGIVLTEGWWYEGDAPIACVKCGSTDHTD